MSLYTSARLGHALVYAFGSATIVVIVKGISQLVRSSDNVVVVLLGAIVGGLLFTLIGLLNGVVNGILQASLYNFATNGNAGPFIDTTQAREASKA